MAITIGPGIAIGAGVAVTPAPASIVTTGLVLHYDFSNPASYSGSGTSVTDLSVSQATSQPLISLAMVIPYLMLLQHLKALGLCLQATAPRVSQ